MPICRWNWDNDVKCLVGSLVHNRYLRNIIPFSQTYLLVCYFLSCFTLFAVIFPDLRDMYFRVHHFIRSTCFTLELVRKNGAPVPLFPYLFGCFFSVFVSFLFSAHFKVLVVLKFPFIPLLFLFYTTFRDWAHPLSWHWLRLTS